MKKIFVLCVLALAAACGDLDSERARTEKLLGVKVKDLPADAEFVEADSNAPIFKAYIRLKGDSAVEFDPSLGQRSSVYATAPDGTVWEAYCGKAGSLPVVSPEMDFRPNQLTLKTFVEPYKGFESTPANTRQNYGTHHGYSFSPLDVFIGRNEAGKLSTKLFFRDVGSHTTAPHHMAIDGSGDVHLVVADVNTSDNNSLDLYWVVGSPQAEKWSAAWLIDHRGFTSVAKVWNGAYRDKVHLLWSWDSGQNKSPDMGLYHIEKNVAGFSRKVRIFKGEVTGLSAAIDPISGRIVVAVVNSQDAYLLSKEEGGNWSRLTPMNKRHFRYADIQLGPGASGTFVMNVNDTDSISTWTIEPE